MKIAGILLALVEVAGPAAAQTRGLPTPTPSPAIYSRPTPAPLAPPVNPGPAVVPPAGLSPLLTEPGPVSPPPQRAAPVYPSLQLPGPVGQQNMRAYRNSLLNQQWQRERSGISPAASVAAKSNSSLTKPARSDHGRGIPGQSQLASLRHRRRSATNRRRNLPVSLSIELPN